jgi:hypothetical protein
MPMKKLTFFIGVVLLFVSVIVQAQDEKEDAEVVISRIYEVLTADKRVDLDLTTLEEDLNYFAQNPININTASKEQLEKLQFISDKQIENLLYYLYRRKQMQTIYELQLVDGFDMFTIRNLLPFVYVGAPEKERNRLPSVKELLAHGKHEISLRGARTWEPKRGYVNMGDNAAAEAADKRYIGDPNYASVKYSFRSGDHLEIGLVGEKDAGEQFAGRYHTGFDFYSGYVQLRHLGPVKTLVLGNLKANFGLGLVIHPEIGLGKSADVMSMIPRNSGLQKSASTDEYNFLRGVGVTVAVGRSELSAFYSYKALDGDSTGTAFSYIKTDGLHRTVSTLNHKNRITMQVAGVNWSCRLSNLYLGFTVVDTRLSRDLEPEEKPYNVFYFRGSHQLAGGLNYRFRFKKFVFFGEEATQSKGGFATLNGFMLSPVSLVNLVVLHRYYSKRYDVLLASAFAEGSKVNNEEGLYVGFEIHPLRRWKIGGYADAYSFPWLRYGVNRPSSGYDALFTANFIPAKKVEMYWRFRYEQKEKDLPEASVTDFTGRYDLASMRYWASFLVNSRLTAKSLVEFNRASSEKESPTFGWMISQEASYTCKKLPLSFDVRCEWFDAVNYDNRIYSYERDVPSVFAVPMLYGRGGRWFGNCQWKVSKQMSLWLKIAQTFYADRNTIGSGLELINSNHKTDIHAVVRLRF